MVRKSSVIRTCAIAVLILLTGAVILGASRSASPGIHDRMLGDRVLPRVQIINFNDGVARFDTVTGEIHTFSGSLRDGNVRGQWRQHTRGVGQTSGFLQIQHPIGVEARDALFLVDVVTGETWSLTRRASRSTWDRVPVYRR